MGSRLPNRAPDCAFAPCSLCPPPACSISPCRRYGRRSSISRRRREACSCGLCAASPACPRRSCCEELHLASSPLVEVRDGSATGCCPCGDGLARERFGWALQETVASQLHTRAFLSLVSPLALSVACSALSQRDACFADLPNYTTEAILAERIRLPPLSFSVHSRASTRQYAARV